MQLTQHHSKHIAVGYCIIFYVLAVFKCWNGLFLFQVKPHLYNTRFDFVTWLLMDTGIHQWLLNNPNGWMLFDTLFYITPLFFICSFFYKQKAAAIAAALMLVTNWIYIQCFTLYPTNSMESYTAWLLFPFLFMMTNMRSFYFVLHALRYFFLFFFMSAGIWKITQGAVFNVEQMSGVLLFQHAEYLTSSPGDWYSKFIYWVVQHPAIGHSIYIAGTILEVGFVIGFFTKKYDTFLLVGFALFLLFDILLMRIHYWEVSAFLLTLYYSKYTLPIIEKQSSSSISLH